MISWRGPCRNTLVGRPSRRASKTGEDAIEGDGFGGLIRDPVRNPCSFLALWVLAILVLATFSCGGKEQPQQPPAPPPDAGADKSAIPIENTAGGPTVESTTAAETLKDSPFRLNLRQAVPPDFRAAYQRKALIVVEFFDEGGDDFYPQGTKVDEQVSGYLRDLRGKYPQVEFFDYDIDRPGEAETSEDLNRGEYGTLAAQLEVGYTPFVVMLAPRGDEYVVENLFQGYVDQGVLDQALFDLTNVDVRGNSSDTDVSLDQIELTESGGGVEYFTVTNEGAGEVNLQGFGLRAVDPRTGEVNEGSAGVQVNEEILLAPGESVSIGRAPNVVDADGDEVFGTFTSREQLRLRPGDQVALLDVGGAVIDTISI
jgi:hypothetical protein